MDCSRHQWFHATRTFSQLGNYGERNWIKDRSRLVDGLDLAHCLYWTHYVVYLDNI